jgi:hypothetical protein
MAKDLSKKVIRNYLDFLEEGLPTSPTAVNGFYKLPKEFRDIVKTNKFSKEILQKISDHMGYFLGILTSVKVNYYTEDNSRAKWTASSSGEVNTNYTSPSASGYYTSRGNEIFLIKRDKYDIKNILAVLAHEYTHHYLNQHGVRKENEEANEILTEIATAYLGLGQLLVDGYNPIVWTSNHYNYGAVSGYTTNTITLGYVTPATIKKAIILSVKRRQLDPDEAIKSFSDFGDRVSAFIKLLPYKIRIQSEKRKRKKFSKDNDFIKKHVEDVAVRYKKFISNFENASKTISPSLISPADGKKFVEIANELSLANFQNELGNIQNGITDINMGDKKKKVNKLSSQISEWEGLLDKYKK